MDDYLSETLRLAFYETKSGLYALSAILSQRAVQERRTQTMSQNKEWYFDTATGEVSEGKTHSWTTRLGPYASQEEAERALETVKERNKAADEDEEE